MVTVSKSIGRNLLLLSKTTLTLALLARGESPAPFQIKSSPFFPRRDLMDCSPNTKRKASAMFDLPEPFGPTIAEIGEEKVSSLFLAKLLNPVSSILLRYIVLIYEISY